MVTTLAESPEAVTGSGYEYDFFISHASEDKDSFVRPLAKALEDRGARVWYDEFTLNVGDSIHEAVSRGLRASRAGIVVLSHDFFAKRWPRHELDGLIALANRRPGNSILPIWHGVTALQVSGFSPGLAGIFALSTNELSLDEIVERLLDRSSTHLRTSNGPAQATIGNLIVDLDRLAAQSFEVWKGLINGAPTASPARLPHGSYEMTFALIPVPNPVNLKAVKERINEAGSKLRTAWIPFRVSTEPEWQPYASGDFVEAWLGREVINSNQYLPPQPQYSEFWRASKDGMLYLINGYIEDECDATAGREIHVEEPILRITEGLLFARRYARSFDGVETLGVRLHFTGLRGRNLTSSLGNHSVRKTTPSRTDEVLSQALVRCSEIDESLTDLVATILANLYDQFGFFELEPQFVQSVLPGCYVPRSN